MSKRAYTLVEILIVMSIMGVMISLLLTGALKVRQKGRFVRAEALMDSVAAAIRMYQDDFGTYPPDDTLYRYVDSIAGTSGECLYYYLGATFKKSVNASVMAGPYLKYKGDEFVETRVTACDFDADGAIDDSLREIVDPWGGSLIYRIPPTKNLNTYDLYSKGPDGVDNAGAGDDINNWN